MEGIRGGPAAAARDPQLFEEFHRRHVDAMTSFVARRVADPHTVADLVALRHRPPPSSRLRSSRGTPIVVSSEHRRVAHEVTRDRRISGRRLLEPDDIARLEDKLDAESPGRRVLAALERLSAGERAVLEQIAVDQLTVSAAAAAPGISQVAARVRLHRARKSLREQADPATADRHSTSLSYVTEGTGGEA